MKTWATCLGLVVFLGCHDSRRGSLRRAEEEPRCCPVCGRAVVPVEQVKDDVSKPSRNIAVWNRSSCGNLLLCDGSLICTHDWYAYSSVLKRWELSLEDPNGFAWGLDSRIRGFPLPKKGKIRSRVVYRQWIDGDGIVDSVDVWCDTNEGYLDSLRQYAKRARVTIRTKPSQLPGQIYLAAEVSRERTRH